MTTILYFIATPTERELDLAKQHNMAIRNPDAYSDSDYIEPCDYIYGNPPNAYIDRYPYYEVIESTSKEVDKSLTVEQLKVLLTEKGIAFDANAKKADLQALLADSHSQEERQNGENSAE